jgi:tetratricopeptide (TPR) repeat protein
VRAVRGAASLALALAALAASAGAWAEWRARGESPEALRAAVQLQSSPWLARAVDAAWIDRLAPGPGDDPATLRQALAARPRWSGAWVRLGLAEERDGRIQAAEQALLEAGRIDRQLAPAWALANFYFRRGDRERFWRWAPQAASRVYDDYRPLLRLADVFEPSPRRLLERLNGGAPLARAYLDFLIAAQRLGDAHQAAVALAAAGDPADDARLADAVSRHIAAGDAARALELWNLRFPRLDPERGPVLANPGPARQPTGQGFDWRMPECAGASGAWRAGEVRFEIGAGPECPLIEQLVPVRRGARYRLRFAYAASAAGLRWRLHRAASPELSLRETWSAAEFILDPAAADRIALARLSLSSSGVSRGWLRLRDVQLEAIP